MLKRLLCLILALLLPCAALAEYTMAGCDETGTYRDWNTNLFFRRMEEKTGVRFTYRQYTDAAEWTRAKAEMLQGYVKVFRPEEDVAGEVLTRYGLYKENGGGNA